jgi:hypothetical protein
VHTSAVFAACATADPGKFNFILFLLRSKW